MDASDKIRMRLFAEAPEARSAELASTLARCLAGYGDVQVHEAGAYWKISGYLEFNVDLKTTGSASACIARLRALEPAGWSGDVWKHRPDGRVFLLPEIRWAWLASPVEHDRQSKASTVAAAAATVLLAAMSCFAVLVLGLGAAMATCDDAERHRYACNEGGFWWASGAFFYLQLGGFGVAFLGAWVWPRRVRWAWIGAGYLIAVASFVISVASLRDPP
ncbi:hypothetical protein AB0M36_17030 [Actinoplanes sp. NPDC051346]|uniref:hypothetical protein n=1 Tax=Actinoplanes sp. NPDC051346 TaxID=3155048 RepID=UPI00341BE2FF